MNCVENLNTLLSSCAVFRQNVQTMHWQIRGEKFFEFHGLSGTLYDELNGTFDTIAERILAIKGEPLTTLSQFVANSQIMEVSDGKNWDTNVRNIVSSLNNFIGQLKSYIAYGQQEKDEGTVNMYAGMIECFEKKLWMWSAYSGQQLSTPASKGLINM